MNDDITNIRPNSDLSKIIIEKNSSTIPLLKPIETEKPSVNLYNTNSIVWHNINDDLMNDYKFGWSFGQYGTGDKPSLEDFMKRLSSAIIAIFRNECSKNSKSTEIFISIFSILQNIITLLTEKMKEMNLIKHDSRSIIAGLHGFIDSYIALKIQQEEKRKYGN